MKYRQWSVASPDGALRSDLERAGLPPLLAAVLAARGIRSGGQARQLLSPGEEPLLPPLQMLGMDRAAARVRLALERGERMAVYGDYDVDGITATCLGFAERFSFILAHQSGSLNYWICLRKTREM